MRGVIIITCFFFSCKSDESKLLACYNNYYRNIKNFEATIEDSALIFTLKYIPAEIKSLQEIKRKKLSIKEDFNKIYNESNQNIHFLLDMTLNRRVGDHTIFENPMIKEYLSFEFEKDIYCLNNDDTLRLTNYLYEDYYGLTNTNKVVISVDKKAIDKNNTIDFNIKKNIPSKNIKINLKLNSPCSIN